MNEQIVGTCGNCGGAVMAVTTWMGMGPPPPPKCRGCGAHKRNGYGPVIPMGPPERGTR